MCWSPLRVALHALLRRVLDAVHLGEQAHAGAREVAPAARVEVQRGAGEVGVAVVEAAGGGGGAGVGVDRLQGGGDGGLLGDRGAAAHASSETRGRALER